MTKKTEKSVTIREKAEDVVDNAREQAIEAYDSARKTARKARKDASEQIESAPLIALGGGLALGALIAALLPTSKKEKELLGPVSDRIRDTASNAAGAAKDAGTARLGELGLTRDKGGDLMKQIVDGALDALKTSAKAASTSVKGE
jgi:ElaB/YqjD/DUF883 family membrane-anchored ribosome-binding protein